MKLDIRKVPFSRYGSFLVISDLPASKERQEGLYLRLIRGGDMKSDAVFRIELIADRQSVPFQWEATPTMIRLNSELGHAEVCLAEPKLIQIRAEGTGVKFTYEPGAYDYAIPSRDAGWEINSFVHEARFLFAPVTGVIEADSSWRGLSSERIAVYCMPDEHSQLELTIEEYRTVPGERRNRTFADRLTEVETHYRNWLDHSLPAPEALQETREIAAYITWSCIVQAEGFLTRPAMYMSKNWMTNIWSWDHCFNAMALIQNQPELAWDQFMIFFDRQDESGMLPDFMNDKFALWNCCKPPIHGWTLRWMMERTEFITADRLAELYEPLARWTDWWLIHRDDDGDGIPQYNHGNDSGWDNSTVFHTAIPVESPDLSAFLIIQMEVLAEIALKLELTDESDAWRKRAEELQERMLAHFWRNDRFIAVQSGSHAESTGDSLLLFMPIVLGMRLPEEVRSRLVSSLKEPGRFVTDHGLATESVNSEFYKDDGYWRGPIWAPSTMLLIEGLKAAGEEGFALELAERFCRMASRSGMAENYDARLGTGLRDPAFTWTSSVFLILANELYTHGRYR